MVVDIERRPYGPESTPDEVEALRGRVQRLEDRVLRLWETPVQTPFSVEILLGHLAELAQGWDRFAVLVDLHDAHRPDAETRASLKRHIKPLVPRIAHVAVCVEANVLMRAAAKFVLSTLVPSVSVHKTEVEALEAIRRALG